MKILDKDDKEIQEIAQPIWNNLIKSSNIKDYEDLQEISPLKCFMGQTK